VLVLSRRTSERIVLPDLNITVTVVSVTGGVVRLGIEAPPDVQVLREELLTPAAANARRPARELCPA
jgi:carbon storage regulator CsrA